MDTCTVNLFNVLCVCVVNGEHVGAAEWYIDDSGGVKCLSSRGLDIDLSVDIKYRRAKGSVIGRKKVEVDAPVIREIEAWAGWW